ncbi:GTPase family protein [Rodentibacter trehalosifermentans]|nr:GTPase [Rodentibacter trehalosifermentans]
MFKEILHSLEKLSYLESHNQFTPQMRNEKLEKIKSIISDRGLHYPLDVSLIGATGVGKSSTINALFGETLAKVGIGVEPETQFITEYKAERFRLHDTAGLGDGLAADERHAINLSDLLLRTFDEKQYYLIDLCLVILDGSSRDMGTAYQILEQIVLKCIEPKRVIVAINQADMAMKGRNWDYQNNRPEPELLNFLNDKACSVKERIKEATGLSITTPVCYSAEKLWNLDKLMDHIIDHIPYERRKTRA